MTHDTSSKGTGQERMSAPRAAIYLRVSTDDQAEHGVSLEVQDRECRAKAVELGASSITEYRDEGISGMKWERPGLQALLSNLGELDVLVVWAKDRLTRDLRHLLAILDTLATAGIRLVAIRESVNTQTAEGILSLQITGALSEYHPRKTAENVKAAMRRIVESGRHASGNLYGYDRGPDKNLVPNPAEAAVVREVFRRVAEGASIIAVVRWLNAEGFPCKQTGKDWHHPRVSYMLRCPTYKGEIRWNDLVVPGLHEALVTEELWGRVQGVLDSRMTIRGRKVNHYTPLFRCGVCGGNTLLASTRIHGQKYPHYYCARRVRFKDPHEPFSIGEGKALAVIYRHTEWLFTQGDLREAVKALREEIAGREGEGSSVRRQLDDLARRRRVNLQALQNRLISDADFVAMNAPLMEEEDRLRQALSNDQLRDELGILEDFLQQDASALVARMQAASVEQQVVLLRGIYERIELLPGKLRFVLASGALDPIERPLPRYYSPKRGVTELGF